MKLKVVGQLQSSSHVTIPKRFYNQATRLDMPNCAFSGSLCLVCITSTIYQNRSYFHQVQQPPTMDSENQLLN